tara:strand:+ start:556 stop:1323 length:768 start_codon:yes stop_codon:yes gene_type:complete
MKDFIKNRIRESLIEERLMDVNDDVDFIYDTYFKKDYEEIDQTGIITDDMFKDTIINTSTLKSPLAIKADKLNLCLILINVGGGNFYAPKQSTISVGPNTSAIGFVKDNGGSIKSAASYLPDSQLSNFMNEFKSSSIKGSIHHELVHWIDDTLHNKHINNRMERATERGDGKITKNGIPINADKMEIQSQIHNIVQLKRKYDEIWDSLTFEDMIKYSPALNTMTRNFSDEVKNQWVRNIKTRMHREGLLGKNMRN